MNPEGLRPPYALLLMGQRFIVDSFVTGQVVWPYAVPPDLAHPIRTLPDPLDVLYGIGNDDVLPLLRGDLALYGYSPNLAAVRYLIDGYEPDFWRSSLYNSWLQAIRTLSRSGRQAGIPPFMTTGAWQQEKMNTQLASWAEIRHDNLLYAKQSYTGIPTSCRSPARTLSRSRSSMKRWDNSPTMRVARSRPFRECQRGSVRSSRECAW